MSHEERLQRGRVGVMDLTSMQSQAEGQLGRERADAAHAAMLSEEIDRVCQYHWRIQERWRGSDSACKWSSRNWKQLDHTWQLGSSGNHWQ